MGLSLSPGGFWIGYVPAGRAVSWAVVHNRCLWLLHYNSHYTIIAGTLCRDKVPVSQLHAFPPKSDAMLQLKQYLPPSMCTERSIFCFKSQELKCTRKLAPSKMLRGSRLPHAMPPCQGSHKQRLPTSLQHETFTFLHRSDFISKTGWLRNCSVKHLGCVQKRVLHLLHYCSLWWQRKVDMEALTLPGHCWHLSANLYTLTLCCHLPWHDLMRTWPQEERLKREATIFIWYVVGQVMAKHFKQGHCEKCKITSLLVVRKMITNCMLFYLARQYDYASIGKRSALQDRVGNHSFCQGNSCWPYPTPLSGWIRKKPEFSIGE